MNPEVFHVADATHTRVCCCGVFLLIYFHIPGHTPVPISTTPVNNFSIDGHWAVL